MVPVNQSYCIRGRMYMDWMFVKMLLTFYVVCVNVCTFVSVCVCLCVHLLRSGGLLRFESLIVLQELRKHSLEAISAFLYQELLAAAILI
jgi:hypothetical protein